MMEEQFTVTLTPAMVAMVPVVGAIIQILKRIEAIQKIKEWLPFFSIGIALGLGYLTQIEDPVVASVIIGLAASGGYDLVKN